MTALVLLADLRAAGFLLRVDGGKLLVTPPGGVWRGDDRAVIAAHRGGLVAALRAEVEAQPEDWPADPAGASCPGCRRCKWG